MTIGIIVQARMGSTRLPGKVLKPIGKITLLEFLLTRLKKSKKVDKIIIATTDKPVDNDIEKIAVKNKIGIYRGSENDVLDRYYQAAKKYSLDTIVRITGDCPFADSEIIDQVVKLFEEKKVEYASNVDPPTYPDGFDIEVFTFHSLQEAWKKATKESDREHVTPYIRDYNLYPKTNLLNSEDLSKIRLTVDNIEDYQVINEIYKKLGEKNNFHLKDIMKVLKQNPNILETNKKHERNKK